MFRCSRDFKVWSPCDEFFSLEQVALRKRSPCLYKVQNLPIPKKPWNIGTNLINQALNLEQLGTESEQDLEQLYGLLHSYTIHQLRNKFTTT